MIINVFKAVQLVLVLCLISTNATLAQSQPFKLKPLTSNSVATKSDANGLATVAMIFQPDCSWCKKQGKTLALAFKQCQSSMNIALVGAKGNLRQLKKARKYYAKGIPDFIADRKFLRGIGGYQASPTTLIYDQKGQLIVKKRGFLAKDKLANALAIISQGACHI